MQQTLDLKWGQIFFEVAFMYRKFPHQMGKITMYFLLFKRKFKKKVEDSDLTHFFEVPT
jgi:hypothetical protein